MRASHKSIRQAAANPAKARAVTSLIQGAMGSRVPETGIYEIIHCGQHRQAHEAVLISGNRFPRCEGCGKNVRFRLLRSAPYTFGGGFRTEA